MGMSRKQITVKPLSFGMTGFKVENLFLKDFVAELKREFPTALLVHCAIGFSDSKDIIIIGHDRREGKYNTKRVDVEGSEAKSVGRVVEVLKRVLP